VSWDIWRDAIDNLNHGRAWRRERKGVNGQTSRDRESCTWHRRSTGFALTLLLVALLADKRIEREEISSRDPIGWRRRGGGLECLLDQ
jgi:hypothetical protein